MGNSREKRSNITETTELVRDRLSEATNDETLSALEKDKKDIGSAGSGAERAPAPDGTPTPDQGAGRSDADSGGPM